MHELSLVEELVDRCTTLARGRTVLEVWARCPAGIDVDELSEGFAFMVGQRASTDGDQCLAAAELNLDLVPAYLKCACGFVGELSAEDVAGHITVCPRCGHVGEADAGLELLGMSFDQIEPLDPA